MEGLRRSLGLPATEYRREPRLQELSFGTWEGRTWKELRRDEPTLYAERERDRWDFVPPGGESYAGAAGRVGEAVAEFGRDTVLVSHGGIARVLLTLRGGAHPREALHASIWQGRILEFRDRRHRWI